MGAAARALRVMGFDDLVFVDPVRSIHHERALATATHGVGILEQAQVVSELEHALADCDLSVATTIRARSNVVLKVSVGELQEHCLGKLGSDGRVAIVFGGESTGLTNAEIDQCDLVASIPTVDDGTSLNLAQAVMIFAYEMAADTKVFGKTTATGPALVAGEYQHFVEQLQDFLRSIGVSPRSRAWRDIAARLPLLRASDIRLIRFVQKLLLHQKNPESARAQVD